MSNLNDTIDRYFAAIRSNDRQAWLDTFSDHPALVHVDPVGAPARNTKAEIGAFWDQLHQLFDRVSLQIVKIHPGLPNQVALTWVGQGTGKNGVAVQFEGIDLIQGDDHGKILRLDAYWDANATLARLMT
ncbi:nuclear transport factor 2 family protein [bacterium]|nr:nuclear transport factor 2 family protein [bacterium]